MTGLISVAGSTPSDTGFELKSIRFDTTAESRVSRTPAAAGNLKSWTISAWIKRCTPEQSDNPKFFDTGDGWFNLQSTNSTLYCGELGSAALQTSASYRDPSAWYHIVLVWDSSNATAGDRYRLYVNGERVTAFQNETYPAQNTSSKWNSATEHRIGGRISTTTNTTPNAYMAEFYNIDGQSLDPSSFGETNALTNQWQPKAATDIKEAVTFGTNGFYLPFSNDALADSFSWSAPGDGNRAGVSVSGAGAGGGGAGGAGGTATTSNGGDGGNGKLYSSFTSYGVSGYFGGGGGGGVGSGTAGAAGSGGGAAGSNSTTGPTATENTGGGGGGGGGGSASNGGVGGSGTVLVKDTDGTYTEFTSSGNYTVPSGITSVEVLIVAGGAGGGANNNTGGGGGGAGGIKHLESYTVTPSATIAVVVGTGGAGGPTNSPGASGVDSSFDGVSAVGGAPGSFGGVSDPGGSGGGPGGQSAATGNVSVYSVTANGNAKNIRVSNHSVAAQGEAHIIGPKIGSSAIAYDGDRGLPFCSKLQ